MITSLDPQAQSDFLRRILARVAEATARRGPRAVLVFDLDGTLYDNRPRTVHILHELAKLWQASRPEIAAKLALAAPGRLAYTLADTLKKLDIDDAQIVSEATIYWKDRFFQDPYMVHDVALAGAARFVTEAYEKGGNVIYLTGRDMPNMSLGSWKSLRDHGFPIGASGAELVCKPRFEIADERYKADVAGELSRLGEVVAVFDNEPANCNALLASYPDCLSVLLDTQRTPTAPDPVKGVITIKDFVYV